LDGFDLGLGILFFFFPRETDRDQMMNSVAPFWDGNETWLILGGTGLFVTFPHAYAVVMPALYVPLIAMLLALVFRGVAFEFRWVAKPHHRKWDIAFAVGSLIATLCQGFMLGGLLGGTKVEQGQFAGGAFDWLTPFTLLCGLGLVVGYTLLAATWLVLKMTGTLERRARRMARVLLIGMLAFIVVVSVWTPLQFERIGARWFAWPNILFLSPVPAATALFAWACWRGLARSRFIFSPFYSAVMLFVIAYIGLVISTYPYIVPPSITVWDAAAAPSSQRFVLIGIAILLPFILGYTIFVYYTFRGKVRADEGYH
ncbi:MAG TPA: cytochrome d ubiquinol oxidase subunit II, partial [Steroidobacteraceae bacterium]